MAVTTGEHSWPWLLTRQEGIFLSSGLPGVLARCCWCTCCGGVSLKNVAPKVNRQLLWRHGCHHLGPVCHLAPVCHLGPGDITLLYCDITWAQ